MYDTPPSDELVWPEAAANIAELQSKVPCDRKKFMDVAVRLCLPVFVGFPGLDPVVCRVSETGQRYRFPVVGGRHFNALLLPHELRQLEYRGGRPVWVTEVVPDFEDVLYIDWSRVKNFREMEHRVDHVNPAFNQGRWMGQNPDMFLPEPILVTSYSSLYIPRHTIDEVAYFLRNSSQASVSATVGEMCILPPPAKETQQVASLESKPEPEFANWKMRVQAEATARFLRLYGAGANPTISSIKDDLAVWCRENKVVTDSGIVPSAEYLRTHVLSSSHWKRPSRPQN